MKKIFTLVLALVWQLSVAQNTTVTVFDAEDAEEVVIKNESVLKNAIKWNWSLLTRGVFMLNYERELKPWVSVEGGLGLCYRDFMFEGMGDVWQSSEVFDETSCTIIKPAIEGRVRFYPFQLNDMEGFYCSLGYLNRNYGTETMIDDVAYESSYKFNESQFLIGWQYESWWLNNILADFYFGVGLRKYKTSSFEEDYADQVTVYVLNEKEGSVPAVYMGFKLSVPF